VCSLALVGVEARKVRKSSWKHNTEVSLLGYIRGNWVEKVGGGFLGWEKPGRAVRELLRGVVRLQNWAHEWVAVALLLKAISTSPIALRTETRISYTPHWSPRSWALPPLVSAPYSALDMWAISGWLLPALTLNQKSQVQVVSSSGVLRVKSGEARGRTERSQARVWFRWHSRLSLTHGRPGLKMVPGICPALFFHASYWP
jgi:hypothetical protein